MGSTSLDPAGRPVRFQPDTRTVWADDERSRIILTRCREAMGWNSKVLVLEWIMPDRVGGLRVTRIIPTPAAMNLIEAEVA